LTTTPRTAGLPDRARAGRRRRAVLEVAGLLLAGLLFTRLHAATGRDVASATASARGLQALERALHLDVEQPLNRWLAGHPSLIPPAVSVYRLYYVVVVGVLVWLFVRHTDVYLRARRTLLAMAGLALLVFWVFPVSPPRFALPGVVDIVADHDLLPGSRDGGGGSYSAMPSLHVGWAAWCAWAVWAALRPSHPRLALLPWGFPLIMVAVVLTTGNHYVLDLVGSALLLGLAVAVAFLWGRRASR
jgi:PAP2 superfamily